MFRVIRDNGTPARLPRWARDEIVERRLRCEDLLRRNLDLQQELAVAQGMSEFDAATAVLESLREGTI